jgi:3-oxoacyl-[acyl-carrier protein] reductase
MFMKLENKVALITGGASGIGEETAYLFAREKAKVVIADIDGPKGEEVSKKITEEGGQCIFIETDVSKAKDVKGMIDNTIDHFGRLDILFNNAGVSLPWTDLEEIGEDIWDNIINVNLKGVFLASKYAVPIMKRQGGGVIINTASMGAVRIRPRTIPYVVSKGGVITLTRALALELAPYHIRVNSISPAVVDTPLFRKITAGMDFTEAKRAMIATIPLGKFIETKDIAYAALYLASDEASMITGINLQVDGGRGI